MAVLHFTFVDDVASIVVIWSPQAWAMPPQARKPQGRRRKGRWHSYAARFTVFHYAAGGCECVFYAPT